MVEDFLLVINQRRLRSKMKALRNFYREIERTGRAEIERGEIIMHLDYFSRIVPELGKKYGTEALTREGLTHIENYKNELTKKDPDPNAMNQSYLGLRNVLFALMPAL